MWGSSPKWTRFVHRHSRIGLLFIVLSALCVGLVLASSGDRQPRYIHCVKDCDREICQTKDFESLSPELKEKHELSASLQLTRWNCLDNCRYHCMHDITEKAIQNGQEVHQYHGKWPFHRVFGMQEPASVVFSLLNGYMHVLAWPRLKKAIPEDYYMRKHYLGFALVGMNTWFWSAVYHSRDWPSTEKLDYFSAGASIMFGLFFTVIRVARMVNRQSQVIWGLLCLVPLVLHISYLSFVHFDYGYNMLATASVGMIHNLIWIGWSIKNWRERPYAWQPAVLVVAVTLAMCLEILDFPPIWGILDAHSLWHAATIPLSPLWYRFIFKDTEWEVRSKKGTIRAGSYRD